MATTSERRMRALDCDRRADRRVRVVALEGEILVPEGEEILHRGVEAHRRQRLWRACQLLVGLLEMVEVEMRVAERVHEFAGLVPGRLRHHQREERVGR